MTINGFWLRKMSRCDYKRFDSRIIILTIILSFQFWLQFQFDQKSLFHAKLNWKFSVNANTITSFNVYLTPKSSSLHGNLGSYQSQGLYFFHTVLISRTLTLIFDLRSPFLNISSYYLHLEVILRSITSDKIAVAFVRFLTYKQIKENWDS